MDQPHYPAYQEEETIDIKKYIFKFLHNWYWFAISGILGLAIAFLINRYSTPTYQTNTSVIVQEKGDAFGGIESIIQEFGAYKKALKKNVENQIGILQSYTLTYETLKELNYRISYFGEGRVSTREIYQNQCPFEVVLDSSFQQLEYQPVFITFKTADECTIEIHDIYDTPLTKTLKLNEVFQNEHFKFSINVRDSLIDDNFIGRNFSFYINNYNRMANAYMKALTVEAVFEKGTVLSLTKTGSIPEKEVHFLNKLIAVFIDKDLREKNISTRKTLEFIDNQLAAIVDSLRLAESNLQNFRLNNRIVDLSKEGISLLEKLEETQARKSILDIRMKYYEYLLSYIEDKKDFQNVITPSVIGIQDMLLNKLVQQLSELYAERSVIEYSARANNPSLDVVNLKINNTLDALIENVNNVIEGARIEMVEVDSEIKKLDKHIQKLPITERKLINIERKFELNDNIYNFLLEKRAEAGIMQASNIPDIKVLDKAIVANVLPIGPKKSLNFLIGLFLALMIPAGIIILKEFFNDKIVERKDIESNSKIPILGTVTHNTKESDLVVTKHGKSSITESFRSLRTNLQYFLEKSNKHVITINSTISGEGKTFCALNLASVIAISNKRTILVGLDLRKPKLHKVMDVHNEKGMSTYLIGKSSLKEIIQKTTIENLDIIASGPIPPNPAELIEGQRMQDIIAELKETYDYIIIDTPPVALVADALLITRHADANIFVIRQNYSSKSVLKFVNDLHDEKKLTNLSLLLNDVDVASGYGYRYGSGHYQYGSYRKYGYGYGYGYYEEDEELSRTKTLLKKLNFMRKV